MNDILRAAQVTVHEAGTKTVAEAIGVSANVLRNKVCPTTGTHHLTVLEASRVMLHTSDYRILHAFASEHGFVCIPLPATTTMPPNQTSFFDRLLNIVHHKGNVCKTLKDAMADGRITPGEVLDMKSAISGLQQELASLSAEFESACPNFKEKTDV